MIEKISIEGFKSITDVELDLGLINILIGPNGSGKSNLLEAVGVMGANTYGSVEPESLKYRGVRLGLPESYKSSHKSQPSRRLVFRAQSRDAKYYVSFENLLFSKRMRWQIDCERLSNDGRSLLARESRECLLYAKGIPGSQSIKISDDQSAAMLAVRIQDEDAAGARSLLEDLEGFAIYAPSTPALRGIAEDVSRDPLGLGGSGLSNAVTEMMNLSQGTFGPFELNDVWELIEWADDMSSVTAAEARVSPYLKTGAEILTFHDRFMRGDHGRLSAYDASEGALYVLFMLTLIGHPKSPRFVGIDNFDQALHPRLACALTRLISDQILEDGSRQMLATTHNPLVLDGLDLLDDRVRLFTVDRDENGASRVERVLVTEELIDQGFSLSRLWTSGRLGGVPRNL